METIEASRRREGKAASFGVAVHKVDDDGVQRWTTPSLDQRFPRDSRHTSVIVVMHEGREEESQSLSTRKRDAN